MMTRCDYCGEISHNQQPGNGCHTCGRGAMRSVEGNRRSRRQENKGPVYRYLQLGISPPKPTHESVEKDVQEFLDRGGKIQRISGGAK